MELNENESAIIRRVERGLVLWRYGRWIQLVIGLLLAGYGIGQAGAIPRAPLLFGLFPPALASVFGGMLIGEVIWDHATKERRLLLKLLHRREDDEA